MTISSLANLVPRNPRTASSTMHAGHQPPPHNTASLRQGRGPTWRRWRRTNLNKALEAVGPTPLGEFPHSPLSCGVPGLARSSRLTGQRCPRARHMTNPPWHGLLREGKREEKWRRVPGNGRVARREAPIPAGPSLLLDVDVMSASIIINAFLGK